MERKGIGKESQIDLSGTEGGRKGGREGICGVLRCLRTLKAGAEVCQTQKKWT